MSKISQGEGLVKQMITNVTIQPARILAWKASPWREKMSTLQTHGNLTRHGRPQQVCWVRF